MPDGLPADVFNAWKTLDDADGLMPYLDYTTPTFYDDLTGAIQRAAGWQGRPGEVPGRRPGDVLKFTSPADSRGRHDAPGAEPARARRRRARGAERPPGEPRRVGYLYLLPAFAVFAAFVLLPLGARHVAVAVRVGRPHAAATWVGLDNYADVVHGRGAARARSGTRWS